MLSLARAQPARTVLPVVRGLATVAASTQPRAAPTRAPRMSGLQKQVLSLYREALRTARKLGSAEDRLAGIDFARDEFRAKAATVDKLDIQRIEFLLRQGKKKLGLYTDPATKIDSFKSSVVKQHSTAALAIQACRKSLS